VHFVVPPRTADDAILSFLRRERNPKAFTIVTSDLKLRSGIRSTGAHVLDSRSFAQSVLAHLASHKENSADSGTENVEEWLKLFEKNK
jgi:hypothetical protein